MTRSMKAPKRLLAFYGGKVVDMNAALAERVPDAKQRFRYACMRVVDNVGTGYVIEGDKVYFLSPASRMAKIVTGEARDKVLAEIAALSQGSRRRTHGDVVRIHFPGSRKTVLDDYSGKQVPLIKGVVRKMARKRYAEEIRRIRRMLAEAEPGSMEDKNLRAYMVVLLRKSGGKGTRYVADEKALPSWRLVPDYKRPRRR